MPEDGEPSHCFWGRGGGCDAHIRISEVAEPTRQSAVNSSQVRDSGRLASSPSGVLLFICSSCTRPSAVRTHACLLLSQTSRSNPSPSFIHSLHLWFCGGQLNFWGPAGTNSLELQFRCYITLRCQCPYSCFSTLNQGKQPKEFAKCWTSHWGWKVQLVCQGTSLTLMRAILVCKPSYIRVCMALPRSRRCSTMAAASLFTCAGSADSNASRLGAAMSVRAAVQQQTCTGTCVDVHLFVVLVHACAQNEARARLVCSQHWLANL